MFIRKTVRRHNGCSYTAYLLVESFRTPEGPRQRTICSLGDLSPGQIRRATTPEPQHRLIYKVLGISEQVMAPVKTWLTTEEVALSV